MARRQPSARRRKAKARKPTGVPTAPAPGHDPVAQAAAQLAAEMPRLVSLALRGARKGKPTVLRAVRGILRDLQKEATARAQEEARRSQLYRQLEALGPLTTFEVEIATEAVNLAREVGAVGLVDAAHPPHPEGSYYLRKVTNWEQAPPPALPRPGGRPRGKPFAKGRDVRRHRDPGPDFLKAEPQDTSVQKVLDTTPEKE